MIPDSMMCEGVVRQPYAFFPNSLKNRIDRCKIKVQTLTHHIDPRGRPQSRPVVITMFTHVVRPSTDHPYVPKFQNQAQITVRMDH